MTKGHETQQEMAVSGATAGQGHISLLVALSQSRLLANICTSQEQGDKRP